MPGMMIAQSAGDGLADAIPLAMISAGLVIALVALRRLMPGKRGPKRDHVGAVARNAEEVAERLAGEMEAKAQRLDGLLLEARAVIERLEGMTRSEVEVKDTPAEAVMDADAVTGRVYAMSDAGKTPIEIARALGQQTGQVELILALRR